MKYLAKKPVQIVILCYFVFIGLYFYKFNYALSNDNAKWGTFGDFLGGALNPILGIITIVLTYDIIKTQLHENKQAEFKYMFQMLFEALDENKNLIEYKAFKNIYTGRKAISIINKKIENLYASLNEVENSNKEANFSKAFWAVYDDINESSSTYMKTLHNCLKVIDDFCVKEKQSTYSDLVRAQLHSDELKFILYNGLVPDFENFKNRLEKFTILKDIKDDNTIEDYLKEKFLESAFIENSTFSANLKIITLFSYKLTLEKLLN